MVLLWFPLQLIQNGFIVFSIDTDADVNVDVDVVWAGEIGEATDLILDQHPRGPLQSKL